MKGVLLFLALAVAFGSSLSHAQVEVEVELWPVEVIAKGSFCKQGIPVLYSVAEISGKKMSSVISCVPSEGEYVILIACTRTECKVLGTTLPNSEFLKEFPEERQI